MAWPPVRMAMSSSMALRRSPKPGAFTAQHVERAAELVDDQRGEGFAFDVFGDDQERLAGVDDGFQHRHEVLDAARSSSRGRGRRRLRARTSIVVRIGDEVRREVAAVELHAFDPLDLGAEALAFFDGDDAVLADLFHGLGEHLADFAVAVARRRCRPGPSPSLLLILIDIFLSSAVMSSTAFSMPCFMWTGLTPATTALRPSLKMASARTVAVVVPSPATSLVLQATSLTIWAPMFS